MRRIVVERYPPRDWNIYVAQASDGDNSYDDAGPTAQLVKEFVLPIVQYFAYLEVGEADRVDDGSRPNSSLWRTYEQLRAEGQAIAMRKVNTREQIFPVLRDLFQRQQGKELSTS
jgi:uncharacterized sporulation protein YeaH/YhbH (DUF444 family)